MEKVVDRLISSTPPYIHVNSTVGTVSHMTFIQTYIALEFLLALELLHGQLRYYWYGNKIVEISQVPFCWMFKCPFLLIQIGKS